jgi:hypothetical protein
MNEQSHVDNGSTESQAADLPKVLPNYGSRADLRDVGSWARVVETVARQGVSFAGPLAGIIALAFVACEFAKVGGLLGFAGGVIPALLATYLGRVCLDSRERDGSTIEGDAEAAEP